MHNLVKDKLAEIEREEGVKIVYACESGSRAWGFPSADSDYDVRFIYVRPPTDYLRLDEPRDVIERPIVGDLDINGWDIRKTLKLFYKSNPTLMEWLISPIVYREVTSSAAKIRQLSLTFYQPAAVHTHYLSMAKTNFRASLQGDEVSLKKYFYVLRPILAMQWIEQGRGVVPTDFHQMLNELSLDTHLRNAIDNLLEKKRKNSELGRGPRIEVLSSFLENELQLRLDQPVNLPRPDNDLNQLNRLLSEILNEVWPESSSKF